jgi:hypothetical protein
MLPLRSIHRFSPLLRNQCRFRSTEAVLKAADKKAGVEIQQLLEKTALEFKSPRDREDFETLLTSTHRYHVR